MPGEGGTIPQLLARRRAEDGGVAALVTDDESISWTALDDASRAFAGGLIDAGLGKGDRIGILLPNGIDWAVVAFGAMRIGVVLVPLSTLLRPPELLAQLQAAAVTHLVAARELRGRDHLDELDAEAPGVLASTGSGGRHAVLPSFRRAWWRDELDAGSPASPMVDALEAVVRPADDLAILFTSGSRGAPKGVIHTHGNALRATARGLDARCIGRGERLYIPMPFFWMGGFGGGLLSVLVAGATLLTESVPEPGRTLAFLERERVTLFRGWPDQAARIAADPAFATADLSSLGPGSLAPVLPPEQRPAPGARANLFGMTESFGPYAADRLDHDMPAAKWGSCGRPFAGVDVRVRDLETGGLAPAGERGEIQLRGVNLMRGICGRTRPEVFDPDGYYATGDIGALDEDGYLWYEGRVDDMFKVKGATVYPIEVEAALRSIPGIRQAHVTNVTADDGREEVGALVVSALDQGTLTDEARARLSSFKVPTVWQIVPAPDEVPMLASGKVDVRALREQLGQAGKTFDRSG